MWSRRQILQAPLLAATPGNRVTLRSATPGWLGQIAMLTGRKLRWDPRAMCILNDAEAARMLGREMRAPWRL